MRKLLPAFVAALMVLGLQAQQPKMAPGQNKPQPVPTGSITGHVICGDTRRPARGAMVMLESVGKQQSGTPGGGMDRMARVGMDGTYALNHVPAGTYAVIAILPGYLSPFDGMIVTDGNADQETAFKQKLAARGTVEVRDNGAAVDDVVLERGAAVSGRVLFPDGSPATQVSIELEDVNAKPGKTDGQAMNVGAMMRTMFTHQSTSTDDEGHFRISGLAPGTYRIAAVQGTGGAGDAPGADASFGLMMLGMTSDPTAMRVYVGDTLHRKDAKTFELRSGEEVSGLSLTLPIDSMHVVSGQLTAKDGRPLTEAKLKLVDSTDDTLVFRSGLSEGGVFRFPSVPPGTYTLTANDGQILKPNPNLPYPASLYSGTPVAAFAEGSTPVLVKDGDVSDVALSLPETALPKTVNVKAPDDKDDEN